MAANQERLSDEDKKTLAQMLIEEMARVRNTSERFRGGVEAINYVLKLFETSLDDAKAVVKTTRDEFRGILVRWGYTLGGNHYFYTASKKVNGEEK